MAAPQSLHEPLTGPMRKTDTLNVSFLQELLNTIAEQGRQLLPRSLAWLDRTEDIGELAQGLVSGRGEASGVAIAGEILSRYRQLEDEDRRAFLMFLAGYEIDFARIKGRPLRLSVLGWLISLVLAVGVALLLASSEEVGLVVGLAMTTTALGTILPILRDSGQAATPFGMRVLAVGAVGEFRQVATLLAALRRSAGTAPPIPPSCWRCLRSWASLPPGLRGAPVILGSPGS